MTGMFKPKVATPAPVKAPTTASPAVQAAADAERQRQRRAVGSAATMLTSAQGASLGMIGTTKLLGG